MPPSPLPRALTPASGLMVDLILGSDRGASSMRLTVAKRRARPRRQLNASQRSTLRVRIRLNAGG
jgi:hypothetical protein